MNLLFDLETDGLLDSVSKIHSLVIYDLDKEELYSFANEFGYSSIVVGLELLQRATTLYGHNIISYDIPVLKKLMPDLKLTGNLFDTLNLSRLIYPEVVTFDYGLWKHIPVKVKGRHSLESWGERLGDSKGSYGKSSDWSSWSREMQDYCEQDVLLNVKLLKFLQSQNYSAEAIRIEMEFQKIITEQERLGCPFDVDKANKLYDELSDRLSEIELQLKALIPDKVYEETIIPKTSTKEHPKGIPYIRRKVVPFNPGSRMQIEEFFKEKYNWKPVAVTEKGNTALDADVFKKLTYPEAVLFAEYFDVTKVMSRIKGSKASWLENTVDGNCKGYMITNGTVTGRCTHKVIANVPRPGSFKGEECRALFLNAPEGFKAVGADASRLELVTFAHYLSAYDGGAYARIVESGDVHTHNQHAAGLATRNDAKTFIYALLYGGGAQRIGEIVKPNASEAEQRNVGTNLKNKFCAAVPAYKQLLHDVQYAAKSRGYIKGLDGRRIPIRSAHSALNALLQSAGAITFKQADIIFWQEMDKLQLPPGYVRQCLQIHDEYNFIVKDECVEQISALAAQSIRDAGKYFNLKCALDSQAKVGKNWMDIH
jgi:DNA polymerase-1